MQHKRSNTPKAELSTNRELATLILAWLLAKRAGTNESAAIRKCARKLRDQTKCQNFHVLMKDLTNKKTASDSQVIECVKLSWNSMVRDGIARGEVVND